MPLKVVINCEKQREEKEESYYERIIKRVITKTIRKY